MAHDKDTKHEGTSSKRSSQSAVYLVTTEPGVQVPGSGFFGPGQRYTAPNDDYVPPRLAVQPCNGAAHAALKKAAEAAVQRREEALANLEPPRKLSKGEREQMLKVPEPVEGADDVSPESLQAMSDTSSPRQLAEGRLTGPGVGSDNRPLMRDEKADNAPVSRDAPQQPGKRAADR